MKKQGLFRKFFKLKSRVNRSSILKSNRKLITQYAFFKLEEGVSLQNIKKIEEKVEKIIRISEWIGRMRFESIKKEKQFDYVLDVIKKKSRRKWFPYKFVFFEFWLFLTREKRLKVFQV